MAGRPGPTYKELMEMARKYQVRLSPSSAPASAPASVAPRSTPVATGLTVVGEADKDGNSVVEFRVRMAASSPLSLLVYKTSIRDPRHASASATSEVIVLADQGPRSFDGPFGAGIGMALLHAGGGFFGPGAKYRWHDLGDLAPAPQDTAEGLQDLLDQYRYGHHGEYGQHKSVGREQTAPVLRWVSEAVAGKWPVGDPNIARDAIRLAERS